MKKLNEYEPIATDALIRRLAVNGLPLSEDYAELTRHAVKQERKLAACREAIEWLLADGTPGRKCGGHVGSSCCCTCARDLAVETLAATAP